MTAADKPLIIIAGPTASGKTRVAVETAALTGGEVISADSMQVYKYMDVGTAKPTAEERRGIPHHLIDVVRPDESFSAARYKELADGAISAARAAGVTPILAGGTGFYINAVLYGNDFLTVSGADEIQYRDYFSELARENGTAYLHERLRAVDPESAAAIHPNNARRVIRALSFHALTGVRFSTHNASQRINKPAYPALFVVLNMERGALYRRIDARTDAMFEDGLEAEVRRLLDMGYHEGLTSMQGLGYKETARYLRGGYSLEQAVSLIKQGTRRYAKRQVTWFKHRAPGAVTLDAAREAARNAEEIIKLLNERVR